jgi:DNA-binding PadR family transcriptional regulator
VHLDKDLVAASATPLVLGILAEGESYGYAIMQQVAQLSGGHIDWTDGMLYPLLHRLERLGQVTSSWTTSEQGRRRKQYALTESGRRALVQRREQWVVVSEALDKVWRQVGFVAAPATA